MFVIRNQGFFYTDEYYAPGNVFRQVAKKTFATKAAADAACAALSRDWIRSERLGDYVFDDAEAIKRIVDYFREAWPDEYGDVEWDYEMTVPEAATDAQVDAIVKRTGVTFAKVFEVEGDEAEEEASELDEELHFGRRADDEEDWP